MALTFALGLYWMGLNQGAESPESVLRDFLTVAAVLVGAALTWEIGARWRGSRRPT